MTETHLFFIRTLCALCLSSCAVAQQTPWEQHLAAGLEALQQNDYPKAEKQFRVAAQEAETLGPLPSARALTYLGLTLEKQSRYSEAEPLYARALAIREKEPGPGRPDVATVLEHYARLLANAGRPMEAEEKTARAQSSRARSIEEKWKEQRPAEVLRVAETVAAPRLIERADPEYTEDARIVGLQGTVELQMEVWPDGRAHNFRLRRGLGLGLDEQAIEAVRKWRFLPGVRNGEAVVVEALVTVHFRLL